MANKKPLFSLLGFELSRSNPEEEKKLEPSFVDPGFSDGAIEIDRDSDGALNVGGSYLYTLNYGMNYDSEAQLIEKYRKLSITSEVSNAINKILNETLSFDTDQPPIEINTDPLKEFFSESIIKRIREEFKEILTLLKFKQQGEDLFRRWYVDGRLLMHMVVDPKKTKEGIKDIRYVDPRKIKKIREIKRVSNSQGVEVIDSINEYYVYFDKKKDLRKPGKQGIKVSDEQIAYTHSGVIDEDKEENEIVLSYLHKAMKPANSLSMLEDSAIIYRISRAPSRRIFYVDVGSLPKTQAEEYMRNIISKYKNKLVYDSELGTVKDNNHIMGMQEDIWLPRKEGSRGTEVSTLDGDSRGLDELDEIEYFKRKLYRSMNIPMSRLESDGQFNLGRASEITRDELEFTKFIEKIRSRFSDLFTQILKVQLIQKKIIKDTEWNDVEENIAYRYNQDQFFQELKEGEILTSRVELLNNIADYVGVYFSGEYVKKNILKMSDEEIDEIQKQNDKAEKSGEADDYDSVKDGIDDTEVDDVEAAPEPVSDKPEPEEEPNE